MAYSVRGNKAPRRSRHRDTERHLAVHSTPPEQYCPRIGDRPDLVGYLEEDGLLLSVALLAAVIVLAVELAVVWQTVLGAKWIIGFW